jgi:hypothetical protein
MKKDRYLMKTPERYRDEAALKKYFQMQSFSEWEHGGMCPWQAYKRIMFKGIKYTLYIRERHEHTTADIMYGWTGLFRRYDNFCGILAEIDLEDDMDVAHPDRIMEGYIADTMFDFENPHKELFERVENKAKEFFEKNKYNPYIPGRNL